MVFLIITLFTLATINQPSFYIIFMFFTGLYQFGDIVAQQTGEIHSLVI
jgi:hypothetical protein